MSGCDNMKNSEFSSHLKPTTFQILSEKIFGEKNCNISHSDVHSKVLKKDVPHFCKTYPTYSSSSVLQTTAGLNSPPWWVIIFTHTHTHTHSHLSFSVSLLLSLALSLFLFLFSTVLSIKLFVLGHTAHWVFLPSPKVVWKAFSIVLLTHHTRFEIETKKSNN